MAKQFQFGLDKVLKLKQALEKTRALELARKQAELRDEQSQLSLFQAEKQKRFREANADSRQLNLFDLQVRHGYLDSLNQKISVQQNHVQETEKAVEAARDDLTTTLQDKRALELLRDHRKEAFRKEQKQKELLVNSEFALRLGVKG
ncbi:MAG: flagellar export protein FliJ [Candidatus Neomarinimicrobiota bacterium]|nr:MAG: flagellar export protein FliJ [Candidatus Neomarinimicrobiota bacterium]